jgi:type I restriction enzyme S subunit
MNPELLIAHFDRICEAPDAIPRLRQFILDLAVRGKLVDQNPNDEPASKLIGNASAIVFSADEPAPFSIAASWIWVRLGAICAKTGSGSTPRGGKAVYQASGVPFLRSQNVYNDGLRLEDVAYISQETHERMSGTAVQPDDLLLNITGGSIGRCCLVPNDLGEANISQHVAIIRVSIAGLHSYLHRLVLSPYFQSFVISEQTGAGRGGLPKNRMDQIPVALPPLEEQKRIVAHVEELMALCDRLEAVRTERERRMERLTAASHHHLNNGADRDTLRKHTHFFIGHLPRLTIRPHQIKQLRQTILSLAVRGQLVPQDPNDEPVSEFLKHMKLKESDRRPFPLPTSWAWVSVGQIGESRLGKMLDKNKNKGTPRHYLRNINVRWFDFDLSDVLEMRFEDNELEEFGLRRGDVLICEGGEPGRTAVWDEREKNIYFQKAIHRVRFSEGVDSRFFANAIRESADSGRLSTYFTGVGIKHFTGKGLASFIFPVAPLPEQHRIVAKIDKLMILCDQLEAQLTSAQTDNSRLLEAVLYRALDNSDRAVEPKGLLAGALA